MIGEARKTTTYRRLQENQAKGAAGLKLRGSDIFIANEAHIHSHSSDSASFDAESEDVINSVAVEL